MSPEIQRKLPALQLRPCAASNSGPNNSPRTAFIMAKGFSKIERSSCCVFCNNCSFFHGLVSGQNSYGLSSVSVISVTHSPWFGRELFHRPQAPQWRHQQSPEISVPIPLSAVMTAHLWRRSPSQTWLLVEGSSPCGKDLYLDIFSLFSFSKYTKTLPTHHLDNNSRENR